MTSDERHRFEDAVLLTRRTWGPWPKRIKCLWNPERVSDQKLPRVSRRDMTLPPNFKLLMPRINLGCFTSLTFWESVTATIGSEYSFLQLLIRRFHIKVLLFIYFLLSLTTGELDQGWISSPFFWQQRSRAIPVRSHKFSNLPRVTEFFLLSIWEVCVLLDRVLHFAFSLSFRSHLVIFKDCVYLTTFLK